MQGYLHQAPLHLGRTTQGRRGHGLCSPAPRRASAQLKAISFIPLPLSHTLSQPPLPQRTTHAQRACLGALTLRCPALRAHWPSLRITPRALQSLRCVCACAPDEHTGRMARLCMHVQKRASIWVPECQMLRESATRFVFWCVRALFWVSVF